MKLYAIFALIASTTAIRMQTESEHSHLSRMEEKALLDLAEGIVHKQKATKFSVADLKKFKLGGAEKSIVNIFSKWVK